MSNSIDIKTLNGVEQNARLLPALEQGYFNVDEMSFEDLLTASVDFASSLTYYNSSLQPSGDWKSFLAANEIVIMAGIINKDVDELRKRLQLPANQNAAILLGFVFDAVSELDGWLKDLARSNSAPAEELASHLRMTIRSSLLLETHRAAAIAEKIRQTGADLPSINYSRLGRIWEITEDDQNQYTFAQAEPQHELNVELVCSLFRRSAFEFFNAYEHLKSVCRTLLPQSLKTQSHDPAISLFITFLKLYRYAQDNLNSFTQRHLDYYYHEILKVNFKTKNPETAILNFSVLAGGKPVQIAANSKFVCARDSELRDVEFSTATDLTVTDAEIAALYTLNFQREDLITPECDMNFVTRIHKRRIPIIPAQEDLEDRSWSLLGDGLVRQADKNSAGSELEIGIAVASKTLFLAEGHRKIVLDLSLSRASKPISYYLESVEQASTRAEFRHSLFSLMLGWANDSQHSDWGQSVPKEVAANINSTAESIDARYPSIMVNLASGNQIRVESCLNLLHEAIEFIQTSKDSSTPYSTNLMHAESEAEFRSGLGFLVNHFLFEKGAALELLDSSVTKRACELGCEKSLDAIRAELKLGRERLLNKYLETAFVLELTTESGWLKIQRYDVVDDDHGGIHLKIITSLSSEAGAVVAYDRELHGQGWETELPLLKLKVNAEATINVYSLLQTYCLDTVTVRAEVAGARNIVAFNNISQLDPSKPFYPFGPMPTTSSYFALAVPEAAKKNIDSFRIHLSWGDLPKSEDGFDGHYSGYKTKFKNSSFTANISILNNGSWQPNSLSQIQNTQLFSARDKKLKEHQIISVQAVEHFRPVEVDVADDELDLGLKTRNGFVKLTIASPDTAFGHIEYPLKLSETLEKNARARPKKKANLPNFPYTPLLNKVSIDYVASSTMAMSAPSGAKIDKFSDKVFRLHPFGVEKVYPNIKGGLIQLLKPFENDGNLLIGLSASQLHGLLRVYFSLSDDSKRNNSAEIIRLDWSYLTTEGWVKLNQERIISDDTKGFLKSGIITFDLPKDISKDRPDMPGALYWLMVSSDSDSTNFCSLHRVKTHAVELTRNLEDRASFDAQMADWTKLQWQPVPSIPRLGLITQFDGFLDIQENEQRRDLVTRVSERIRHRARAVTPWDYERLVLEQFPYVGKVLCLPNLSKTALGEVAGNLLVIVVPRVVNEASAVGRTPRLSAVYLGDIQDYLTRCCSMFTSIEVANPSYEWVQVRCTAVFEKHASGGQFVEQLNADISKYLNPWQDVGYGLNFCQSINREDVYSYIYDLDYIKYVTDFSMLHITRDLAGNYELGDTVTREFFNGESANVTPLNPWSLIVPLKRHYIEVTKEVRPINPEITGIRELEIGSTFIVGGA
ncbi:MAG: hypothetical protein ACI95C_001136 [Pseudohongiellaceae bacterium]|jgi:hypothetical protein